jgi:hypothetical protein
VNQRLHATARTPRVRRDVDPMRKDMMRKILRVLIPSALLLGSLPLVNLIAFHVWAAGGPACADPQWHFKWANRFGLL